MALSSAVITMKLADMLGVAVDTRRTRVWVSTNVPGDTVIDSVGNAIRLGTGITTPDSTGAASISVWVPGAGSNPVTWQTSIHVDYLDSGTRSRKSRTFGPFTITGSADLADLVEEQEVPAEASLAKALEGKGGNTWDAAWASNDEPTLRAWFATNTGPRVVCDYDNPLSGLQTITTQGQMDALMGKVVEGAVLVDYDNPEIRDFVIVWDEATGTDPLTLASDIYTSGNLHHVKIDGQHSHVAHTAISSAAATTQNWAGWTIHHNEIVRCSDGLRILDNAEYDYNYIHDPMVWVDAVDGVWDVNTNPHSDGAQSLGANPFIRRSFIDIAPPDKVIPDANRNIISGLIIYPEDNAITAGEITENYLNGGTTTIRFPGVGGSFNQYPTGVTVADNKFGNSGRRGLWFAGPSNTYVADDVGFAGITRTGNTWIGTDDAVPLTNDLLVRETVPALRLNDVGKSTGWRKLFTWNSSGTITYSMLGGTTLPTMSGTVLAGKSGLAGGVYILRVGSQVWFQIVHATLTGAGTVTITLPSSFCKGTPPGDPLLPISASAGTASIRVQATSAVIAVSATANLPGSSSGSAVAAQASWRCDVAFPDPADWPGASI